MTHHWNNLLSGCRAFLMAAIITAGLSTPRIRAQVSTADILGTAFDPAGGVLVGVSVTATICRLARRVKPLAMRAETSSFRSCRSAVTASRRSPRASRALTVLEVIIAAATGFASTPIWRSARSPNRSRCWHRPPPCSPTVPRSVR